MILSNRIVECRNFVQVVVGSPAHCFQSDRDTSLDWQLYYFCGTMCNDSSEIRPWHLHVG